MKITNKLTQKFRNKQKRRTKKIGGVRFRSDATKIAPYTKSMENKENKKKIIKDQASK